MKTFATPQELVSAAGQRLGESPFQLVDQARVNAFAELTGDRQWIHTDPERARAGPFGRPVVHGFLALSLLTAMLGDIFRVEGADLVLNKGLDRLRFRTPVPVGARVRAVADLASATLRPRGFTEAVVTVALELEHRADPALTVHQRLLYHSSTPASTTEVPASTTEVR